jgi:hypothetical protein
MESERFDRLSRSLSASLTRRTSLGLATLLGLAPLAESDAKKRKKRKKKKNKKKNRNRKQVKCPSGYTACGKQCFDLSDNENHCGACAIVCSPGKTCCQGTCVDLQDHDSNCGACGRQCGTREEDTPRIGAAEICQAGACIECSLKGDIKPEGGPRICCRGLTFCAASGDGSRRDRCVSAGESC